MDSDCATAPKMTPSERYLLEAVARRTATLQKYTKLALDRDVYIHQVFGIMALNVIRTLLVLCGKGVAKGFLTWVVHSLRDDEGLCICGNLKTVDDLVCGACDAEFQTEDQELESVEQMHKDELS